MPVQRREGHLVEVDEADVRGTGAGECGGAVRADATAPDDNDVCGAQAGEPGVAEKYAVACELFEDELCVSRVSRWESTT